MITLLFLSVFGIVGLTTIGLVFKKKRMVMVMLIVTLCAMGSIFALNCKFFEVETMMNLFSPPDDIWVPLASTPLSATSTVYSLDFQNKYPGSHRVKIVILPKPISSGMGEENLGMSYEVFNESQLLLHDVIEKGTPLLGINDCYGFGYCRYETPQDLPRSVPLLMKISLLGNIAQFLMENEGAELVIQKSSDK